MQSNSPNALDKFVKYANNLINFGFWSNHRRTKTRAQKLAASCQMLDVNIGLSESRLIKEEDGLVICKQVTVNCIRRSNIE